MYHQTRATNSTEGVVCTFIANYSEKKIVKFDFKICIEVV